MQYVGGPLYAPHLFKPLGRLCEVEEPAVREKVGVKFKLILLRLTLFFETFLGSGKHQEHLPASKRERSAPANHPDDRKTHER